VYNQHVFVSSRQPDNFLSTDHLLIHFYGFMACLARSVARILRDSLYWCTVPKCFRAVRRVVERVVIDAGPKTVRGMGGASRQSSNGQQAIHPLRLYWPDWIPAAVLNPSSLCFSFSRVPSRVGGRRRQREALAVSTLMGVLI